MRRKSSTHQMTERRRIKVLHKRLMNLLVPPPVLDEAMVENEQITLHMEMERCCRTTVVKELMGLV
jgi:hypothetical protein